MERRKKIFLHLSPFLTMAVLSPAEVYKKETYGLLFSLSETDIIHLAYPQQAVERKFNELSTWPDKDKYLLEIAKNKNLNFFGDYHSHTDGYGKKALAELSEFDEKFLRKNPGLISIVLALNSHRSFLKGEMAAFHYDKSKDKIVSTKIVPSKELRDFLRLHGYTLSEFYIEKQKKDKIKK